MLLLLVDSEKKRWFEPFTTITSKLVLYARAVQNTQNHKTAAALPAFNMRQKLFFLGGQAAAKLSHAPPLVWLTSNNENLCA